ncbi:MAG: hypothetical protein AABZ70_01860 [candidate division NC10 bacterium]
MAQAHGAGDFAWTLTPHPISNQTPEELAERARRLVEEVVALLTRLP